MTQIPDCHPDAYVRHFRTAREVESVSPSGTVLSVGDQWNQLASYLPSHDVTALDIAAPEQLSGVIQADFRSSGAPSDGYDFVVACDVLEHIPPDDRGLFLKECRRVASRAAFVAFPSGTHAIDAERIIRASSRNNWREALEEHHLFSLPDLAVISAELDAVGASYRVAPLTSVWEWFASFLFDEDGQESRRLLERYCSLMMDCVTAEVGPGPVYRYLVVIDARVG
jgi:hypothetical protein